VDFLFIIPSAVTAAFGYFYVTNQSDIKSRLGKIEELANSHTNLLAKLDKEIGILQSQNATQLRAVEKLETQLDDIRDYR
jgi:archaellum component FlaC